MTLRIVILLVTMVASSTYAAQVIVQSVECATGTAKVRLPVALNTGFAEEVGGLQFDLHFATTDLKFEEAVAGEQALASEKSIYFSQPRKGVARVIVVGLNQNLLGDGVIVEAIFSVPLGTGPGRHEVGLDKAILSDLFGNQVPVKCVPGFLAVLANGETPGEVTPEASASFPGRSVLVPVLMIVACLVIVCILSRSRIWRKPKK